MHLYMCIRHSRSAGNGPKTDCPRPTHVSGGQSGSVVCHAYRQVHEPTSALLAASKLALYDAVRPSSYEACCLQLQIAAVKCHMASGNVQSLICEARCMYQHVWCIFCNMYIHHGCELFVWVLRSNDILRAFCLRDNTSCKCAVHNDHADSDRRCEAIRFCNVDHQRACLDFHAACSRIASYVGCINASRLQLSHPATSIS